MAKDFVSQHIVDGYDVHIRKLIPGYELVHQHILAILKSRFKDEKAKVLIVGCGTGYELGYLLECFPNWQFVATDLSQTMLDKAKTYVQPWNTENRVQFILGDCDIHQFANTFDLVFSVLVGHFVPYLQKANFFKIYRLL